MKEIRWKVFAGEVLFVEEAAHRWDEFLESHTSQPPSQEPRVRTKVSVDLSLQGLPDSVVTFICRTVLPWIAEQAPELVELNFQRCGLSPQGVRQLVQGVMKYFPHMKHPTLHPQSRCTDVQLCLAENEVEDDALEWIHECLASTNGTCNGVELGISLDLSGNPVTLDAALPLLTFGFGPHSSYRVALEASHKCEGEIIAPSTSIRGLSLLDTDIVIETPAQLQLFADLLLTHPSLKELALNWSDLAGEDLELLYSAAASNINKNSISLKLVNVDPDFEGDSAAVHHTAAPTIVCMAPEQILPTPKMQALFCLNKQLREELAESRRQNELLMKKLKKRKERRQLLKAKAKEAASATDSAPSSKPVSRTNSLNNVSNYGKTSSAAATSIAPSAQSDSTGAPISVFGVPASDLPARTQRLLATRPVNAMPLKTLKPAAAPLSKANLSLGTSRTAGSGQSWH